MTVTRPSIWKLKVNLAPFSSSKTSAGETLAALLDSSGIACLLRLCRESFGREPPPGTRGAPGGGGVSLTDSRPPRSLTEAFANVLFSRPPRQLHTRRGRTVTPPRASDILFAGSKPHLVFRAFFSVSLEAPTVYR